MPKSPKILVANYVLSDLCYAIPGKIIRIEGDTAWVDFGDGVEREIVLAMVEAKVGDYVLVHAGYAIKVVDEEEAKKTLEVYAEVLSLAAEEARR